MKKIMFVALLLIATILQSCTSIKGYQKMYLNDDDMSMDMKKIRRLEHSFHTYREGASGGKGAKSGGGCGCN